MKIVVPTRSLEFRDDKFPTGVSFCGHSDFSHWLDTNAEGLAVSPALPHVAR